MQIIENDDLSSVVLSAGKPVFVDFYADWCGPCKMTSPIFEQMDKDHSDKILFIKINVDQNPMSTAENQVRSIPTFVLFDSKGKVDTVHIGGAPKTILENLIKKYT